MSTPDFRWPLLLALTLPACSEGGSDDRPHSDVQIAASHHLIGFRGPTSFTSFPVVESETLPDRGTLNMFADSTYTVTRSSGTSSAESYALEVNGEMSVMVAGVGREPSVVLRGAYGLNGDSSDLFFTDRVSTPGSPSVGLFCGTKIVPGQTELGGGWHLMSLHVIFAGTAVVEARNVGRAAHGTLDVAAGAPGTARAITGTGTESSGAALTFGGTMQDVLDVGGQGDGTINLTVRYEAQNQPADDRVLLAVAGNDLIMAVDADETDGEAGLAFLVRAFDAPATPVDPAQVPGEYLMGALTLFINPLNSGTDGAVGRLTLTPQDAFRFDMVGNRGIDFVYTGTYAVDPDGSIEFTVDGTSETWFGAINQDYNTLAVVDDFVETRSNSTPEVNLFVGVREKTN